jgi:hypothetical protein
MVTSPRAPPARAALGAGSAGEVVEVDAGEDPAVGGPDGGADGVHPVLVRAGVGGGVDGAAGGGDQLHVVVGQIPERRRRHHARTVPGRDGTVPARPGRRRHRRARMSL